MCGIFGVVVLGQSKLPRKRWVDTIEQVFALSETRGKEAAGLAVATQSKISVYKDSIAATQMLNTLEYTAFVDKAVGAFFDDNAPGSSLASIGHSRLVTNGLQGIDANNQPVRHGGTVLVHNGIVVNNEDLWLGKPALKRSSDVDTEIVAALLDSYRGQGMSVVEATSQIFNEVVGECSVAAVFEDLNLLLMATNTGSLYVALDANGTEFYFVSERYICQEIIDAQYSGNDRNRFEIRQVKAGSGMILDLSTLSVTEFTFNSAVATGSSLAKPSVAPLLGVQRQIEDKAEHIIRAREKMVRCSKCLLPETMPFIAFDEQGVCNYCHSYVPMVRQDRSVLEGHLSRYRKTDGAPDCLVAFSGGRDSSYGLHLLRTEFDMHPVAYTYDWGMVTDLGRRNQARLCGKLGIEHIWVSADIKRKREYVRKNISAWMKKPDLGMVPLFIAGDKHTFAEGNKVMEQCGVDLIVYCPNKLEKTDFKTGFCGVKPDASEGQPFALGALKKYQLALYYGSQFLRNPHYINKSMMDTFAGFYSLYYQAKDYTYLYDYVDWEESVVDRTIIDEYGWELAADTKCAWRIGDGTAPFYNYVYYTIAGFTEHDTFRSNQIREGQLTRSEGMKLVNEENQPRWDSFREYTRMINLDFDELVRTIDRMPKLYMHS